ncbi:MAG: D-Ala-D-Ala carboxypeptidase family metallohydrolase [Chromatiales bacterium]|nr:D-Ala-D-Ala carboxypeptidase family metallohydrolase [Chromatiales bacterium]
MGALVWWAFRRWTRRSWRPKPWGIWISTGRLTDSAPDDVRQWVEEAGAFKIRDSRKRIRSRTQERFLPDGSPIRQFSPEVERAIESAEIDTGTSRALLRTLAYRESKGDPNEVNDKTGATGLFQFKDKTAKGYGLIDERGDRRTDPLASARAAGALANDNRLDLAQRFAAAGLGAPTDFDVFMAHQQGASGWTQIRQTRSIGDLPPGVRRNMLANGAGLFDTTDEFTRLWRDNFAKDAAAVGYGVQDGNLTAAAPAGAGNLSFKNPGQDRLDTDFDRRLRATGLDLNLTSGYRSPEHNASVGGARGSMHTRGLAADIDMAGMSPDERAALVRRLHAQGIPRFGTYTNSPNMLHVDMSQAQGALHAMHDRSARNMGNAPDWFQETIQSLRDSDLGVTPGRPQPVPCIRPSSQRPRARLRRADLAYRSARQRPDSRPANPAPECRLRRVPPASARPCGPGELTHARPASSNRPAAS